MSALPYYQMYPKDFESDQYVELMDNAQRGIYLRLLNTAWNNNGIPNDENQLAMLAKEPIQRFRKLWPGIAKCWEPSENDPGKLVNHRQEAERSKAIRKSKTATDSIRSRYERTSNEGDKNIERSSNVVRTMPYARLISESVSDSSSSEGGAGGNTPRARPSVLSDEQQVWFAEFWGLYWRSVAKKPAMVAFGKTVRTGADWVAVKTRLLREKPDMLRRDAEKRPHAATWLNREDFSESLAESDPDDCPTCGLPPVGCVCFYNPNGGSK